MNEPWKLLSGGPWGEGVTENSYHSHIIILVYIYRYRYRSRYRYIHVYGIRTFIPVIPPLPPSPKTMGTLRNKTPVLEIQRFISLCSHLWRHVLPIRLSPVPYILNCRPQSYASKSCKKSLLSYSLHPKLLNSEPQTPNPKPPYLSSS